MFSDFLGVFLEIKFRWKNLLYFEKSAKNFFLLEKKPDSSFKIGDILGGKMKNPIGSRHFFSWKKKISDFAETSLKLLLEPLVLHVLCRSRVHLSLSTWTASLARSVPKAGAPNCDTPTLTTADEAGGNELPPYLLIKKVPLFFMKIYRNEV